MLPVLLKVKVFKVELKDITSEVDLKHMDNQIGIGLLVP